ncbi:MAG TPA: hypothetical protein PLY35_09030 [Thermotogota bacterium]|nr:hypothetical protein [Thermotogota bacterium]
MSNVYVNFNLEDDVVTGVNNKVTFPLLGSTGSLGTFYTSSAQYVASGSTTYTSTIGKYYYDVYDINPVTSSAAIQFSIAYGHYNGGGALTTDYDYPTKAIYKAYKNLLTNDGNDRFIIDGTYVDDAIFISFKRNKLREKLDPGNWQLNLVSGSFTSIYIDDSQDGLNNSLTYADSYNIISSSAPYEIAGKVYPQHGVLVFDCKKVKQFFTYNSGSTAYMQNHEQFLKRMQNGYFQARSMETISSTYYFVRVKNKEFNYSSNPTFYSGSNNNVLYDEYINDPKTYITSIGLYNENNELVAVSKLSQPIKKSFSNELTVQVRLDF